MRAALRWLLILSCLLVVQYSRQISLIAQKNNSYLITTCATKNLSETLTWITPYDPIYYRDRQQKNDFNKYLSRKWLQQSDSYPTFSGPVFDPRWQELKTHVSFYTYYQLHGLVNFFTSGDFEVHFSMRYKKYAEMKLYYNNYWTLEPTLRFREHSLDVKICLDADCIGDIKQSVPIASSRSSWNHYSLKYANRMLQLIGTGRSVIFEVELDAFNLQSLQLTAKDGALLKVHNYEFVYSNYKQKEEAFLERLGAFSSKICVSAYFYFRQEITLRLKRNTTLLKEQMYRTDKVGWRLIKFEANLIDESDGDSLTLWISYEVGYNLFASHIKINQDCVSDVNKIVNAVDADKLSGLYCAPLNDLGSSIQMGEADASFESSCASDEFGGDCIKCKSALGTEVCAKGLTCVAPNKCYCQPGFHGIYCNNTCTEGAFGSNCKSACGHCKDPPHCNVVNGFCSRGCQDWYTGPRCLNVDLPYLQSTPIAQTPCNNSCVISFKPNRYNGNKKPTASKLQVFENGRWMEVGNIHEVPEADIEMLNLNVSTRYKIRIVLCHDDECMEGAMVPELTFTTHCRDITRGMLQESIYSRKISFDLKNPNGFCHKEIYDFLAKDDRGNRSLNDLLPNSNYSIGIYKDASLILEFPIATDEEAPGIIRNALNDSTATAITLFWDPPDESVGRIVNYSIAYELKPTADCKDIPIKKHIEYCYRNSIQLHNLKPYSEYSIQVQAFNKYAGEIIELTIKTKPSDLPNANSYNLEQALVTHDSLELTLRKNCEHAESEVFFTASLECSAVWCRNITESNVRLGENNVLEVNDLAAFTNYTVKIFMAAAEDAQHLVSMESFAITTKPGEPNELRNLDVFSIRKDGTYSVAFDLPHPPTGILEEIMIGNERVALHERCKLWKDRFCYESNLCPSYANISLKNYNVSNYKTYQSPFINCREGTPDPPKNLRPSWDEDFNLLLSWERPLKMNGEFGSFEIEAFNANLVYKPEDESLYYYYKIGESELCTGDIYPTVNVFTRTAKYKSPPAEITVKCPPKKPELQAEPHVMFEGNILSVDLPKFSNPAAESYVHVVVQQSYVIQAESRECDPRRLVESTDRERAWIAFEERGDLGKRDFTLGKRNRNFSQHLNCYYYGRLLQLDRAYKVYVILTNVDGNVTRRAFYKLNANTLGRASDFLYLLLIPLATIILIVGIHYYKERQVSKNSQVPRNDMLLRLTNNGD